MIDALVRREAAQAFWLAVAIFAVGWLVGVVSTFAYAATLEIPTCPGCYCETVVPVEEAVPVDADVVGALADLEAARERTRTLYSVALSRARELIELLEGELAECEAAKVNP